MFRTGDIMDRKTANSGWGHFGTKYILVFDFISQLLDIEISFNFAGTP